MNDSNEGCADISAEHGRRIPFAVPGDARRVRLAVLAQTRHVVKRATAPVTSPQRTIGEILLEHGYVTEEDLSAAVQRQQETGFPLGQILVEAGAITRLELASALAVQWADVAPARAPAEEEPKGRGRGQAKRAAEPPLEGPLFGYTPPPDDAWRDEVRTAARAFAQRLDALEVALDELREEESDGDGPDIRAEVDELVGPVAGRLDDALARLASVEARLGDSAEHERAAAAGADVEALREELARRAEVFTSALETLAAQLEHRAEAAALEEVRARLASSAERTEIALAEIRGEVAALAMRPAPDDGLRGAIETVAARVEGLVADVEALANPAALEELRRALDSLADRPSSDPVLAAGLAELAQRVDALPPPAASGELEHRVDELSAIVGGLTTSVSELGARPATMEPAADERLDALAARIDALADPAPLEELRGEVAELALRPTHDHELAGRVDDLALRLDAIASRLDALPEPEPASGAPSEAGSNELAGRVVALDAALDELGRRIEESEQAWGRERSALETRLAEIAEHAATAPVGESVVVPAAAAAESSASAEHDLNRLWFAVERLSLQLTEHHRTLGTLMGGSTGEEGRIEALVARIESLEETAGTSPVSDEKAPATAAGQPGGGALHAQLNGLARRVEDVAEEAQAEREKLLNQIEQMMSSIDWRFQRLESGGKAA